MAKPDQSAVLQWTQLSKVKGTDPLGMQHSSVRIYQRQLLGISDLALRSAPDARLSNQIYQRRIP